MRGRYEAELFEIGHHVADGGGAQLQAGLARQRSGTDRLAVPDVAFNKDPQKGLSPLAQRLFPTFVRHTPHAYRPSHPQCAWRAEKASVERIGVPSTSQLAARRASASAETPALPSNR